MAYVIERESRAGARFVGMYKAVDGKYKSAGTFASHERAYEVADQQERHERGRLEDTGPGEKATKTIAEFCEERFLPFHSVAAEESLGMKLMANVAVMRPDAPRHHAAAHDEAAHGKKARDRRGSGDEAESAGRDGSRSGERDGADDVQGSGRRSRK